MFMIVRCSERKANCLNWVLHIYDKFAQAKIYSQQQNEKLFGSHRTFFYAFFSDVSVRTGSKDIKVNEIAHWSVCKN